MKCLSLSHRFDITRHSAVKAIVTRAAAAAAVLVGSLPLARIDPAPSHATKRAFTQDATRAPPSCGNCNKNESVWSG